MQEEDLPPYKQLGELLPAWGDLASAPTQYQRDERGQLLIPREAKLWATEALLRAAAYETGAIEDLYEVTPGATQEIAQETDGWEEHLISAGEDVPDKFRDQLDGYHWARDYAANPDSLPLTAAAMREVHKIVCRTQSTYDTSQGPRPLEHGNYKKRANYVTDRWGIARAYCPVPLLDSEIGAAFDFYRMLEDHAVDSTTKAAFLHWAIAHIHPFHDGNGRTARVLASVPLLASDQIPMLVFSDRKRRYLQALDAADYAKPGEMLSYTIDRVKDTVAWWLSLAKQHTREPLDTAFSNLADLLAAQTEPAEPPEQVTTRVKAAITGEVSTRLEPLLSQGFKMAPPSGRDSIAFQVSMDKPYAVASSRSVSVRFTDAAQSQLQIDSPKLDPILLRIAEISPTLSTEASIRIGLLADVVVSSITRQLHDAIEAQARARGQLPQR